jgi:hypothetical protein
VPSSYSPRVSHRSLSGYDKSMFKCGQCGSSEFQLVLQQGRTQEVPIDLQITPDQDMRIVVGGQSYLADLPFMNRYAVCRHCESIRKWRYHYPKGH